MTSKEANILLFGINLAGNLIETYGDPRAALIFGALLIEEFKLEPELKMLKWDKELMTDPALNRIRAAFKNAMVKVIPRRTNSAAMEALKWQLKLKKFRA